MTRPVKTHAHQSGIWTAVLQAHLERPHASEGAQNKHRLKVCVQVPELCRNNNRLTQQMSVGYNSVDLAEAVSSDLSSGECDGADGYSLGVEAAAGDPWWGGGVVATTCGWSAWAGSSGSSSKSWMSSSGLLSSSG